MTRIEMTGAKVLEKAQIEHILLFLKSEDPDLSLLRSFATNWFAYKNRGPFLNKNGRPKWLNKFHPVKHADLLRACDFRSLKADRLVGKSGKKGDLVVDHAIPFSCLRKLLADAPRTHAGIVKCLEDNLRLGVLTKDENSKLDAMQLRSSMPDGAAGPTARYDVAKIKLATN
jgi:hypothetical protein